MEGVGYVAGRAAFGQTRGMRGKGMQICRSGQRCHFEVGIVLRECNSELAWCFHEKQLLQNLSRLVGMVDSHPETERKLETKELAGGLRMCVLDIKCPEL